MPHSRTDLSGWLPLSLVAAAFLMTTAPAFAQAAPDPVPTPAPLPAQIELNLINLPTTQSISRHHSYFRLTHRFERDLRRGDFGDIASDLFSLDNGAVIGLEYRFAVTGNLQAGVHRSTFSKTIWTFARWDALRQGDTLPLSLSVIASVEGLNNMRLHRQPGVAATVSRTFGDVLAIYATPAYVAGTHAVDVISGHEGHDTGLGEDEHANHDDTSFLGLGARVRVCGSCYITGEYTPRLSGYDPNASTWGVALEKRTGGHTFQINFTNSFGTTLGQIARGGSPHDVYLGFNITRKF